MQFYQYFVLLFVEHVFFSYFSMKINYMSAYIYQWNTGKLISLEYQWYFHCIPLEYERYFHWNASGISVEYFAGIPLECQWYLTGIPVV